MTPLQRARRARRRTPSAAAFVAQLAAAMPHPWVVYAVVAANVAVFALAVASGVSAISPGAVEVFGWGANFGPSTVGGEWWRLATCAFLHFGVVHLAMNLWCLWLAGPLAERLLGHGAFAAVYLTSAVGGSLASMAWNPVVVSAGASGAVFGTYGALLACALRLRRTVPVAMFDHLRASAGLFVLFNVLYGMRDGSIDHAAHVGGLLVGCAGAWLLGRPPADGVPRAPLLRVDWRFAAGIVAVLAAGVAAAVWRVGDSDVMRVERAWEQMERAEVAGRFDEALAHADAMLEHAAAHAPLHGRRGLYLGNLGRHEEALQAADRAIALAPAEAMWHSNRAWSLGQLARYDEGERAARDAMALDPGLMLARFNLLVCLQELGRHDEVLLEAGVAVARDGGDARAHAWLGRALSNLQRYGEALAAIDRSLALDAAQPWARQHRSWLLEQLGK